MKTKIIVAVTGASGSIYARILIEKIAASGISGKNVALLFSENAKAVWQHELPKTDYTNYPFPYYGPKDFNAPFASGSAGYDLMIAIPCSMGTLGRIASGTSDDLMIRAADVMLKERKKLILVTRETPLNLIHINNMKTITEAGGIICPACPSFYSLPSGIEQIAETVVDRVLDLSGLSIETFRWGRNTK